MENYGIIEIDKQFQYNPFPSIVRGYKFSEEYNTTVTSVEISNWLLIKKIKQQQQPHKNIHHKYNHLAKWFNPNLQVDIDTAHKYLEFELPILKRNSQENFRNKENISNTWFDNYPDKVQELKKYKVKDPIRQYNYRYINLDKINDKYELGVKGTSKRFYSILTNLNSDYRNFLRYDNQSLVSIDISNSQPYFSLKLLDPEFWERKQFKLLFPYNSTISLSINSSSSPSSSIILVKTLHEIDKQEVELYKELVTSGELYDYLADLIKKETGIIYETRREKKDSYDSALKLSNICSASG